MPKNRKCRNFLKLWKKNYKKNRNFKVCADDRSLKKYFCERKN